MLADIKKLKRAGIEPARVFARRDFDPDDNRPVLHYVYDEREFYSPHFPSWMFEGGDDLNVIEKAIDRYGLEEAPVTGAWFSYAEFLFDYSRGRAVGLTDPVLCELKNGAQAAFYPAGLSKFVAATPVMYALRRWGEGIGLNVETDFCRIGFEGRVVGVIRLQDASTLKPVED